MQSSLNKEGRLIDLGSVNLADLDPAQALRIQDNRKILVEATQQLEKMLFESQDAGIIASNIITYLGRTEIVLLSCTTVVDFSTLANCQKSRASFNDTEQEAFCLKFSRFVTGPWRMREVFGLWEELCKVS